MRPHHVVLILAVSLLALAMACGGGSSATENPEPAIQEATPAPLTPEQVQGIVDEALDKMEMPQPLSEAQVKSIIDDAVDAIQMPEGLTSEEMEAIVSAAILDASGGLTETQVRDILAAVQQQSRSSPGVARFGPPPLIQDELVGLLAEPGPDCGDPVPPDQGAGRGNLAAEITGIHKWLNSRPLCLAELRGNVVLIDFWTYTCVNCIRTFPYLKLWNARYADDGLVILGIHTPEFEFEENPDNVQKASADNGIVWPVALDNDYGTWRAYSNRYWPAKYLIDKDGIVRYTHFGEGDYAGTEMQIRQLLEEAGADLSLDLELPTDQVPDPDFLRARKLTRELYAGYGRGCYTQYVFDVTEFCASPDRVREYSDPGDHEDDLIYLEGPWLAGEESLRYAPDGSEAEYSDYMAVKFSAKSANVVLTPDEGGEPFKVLVTLDGQPLTEDNKGEDVVIEADGRSFMVVDEPRLYSIVEVPDYGTYELKMSSNSPHFAIFAFTFGIYTTGI